MKYAKPAAAVAATIVIGAGAAHAGNLAQPAVDPEVVMEPEAVAAASTGSGGFIVPLLLLVLIAAIASSSSGGGGGMLPEE